MVSITATRATFPINSLAPGKFEWNFRHVIFKQILVIDGWGIACEIALIWISLDLTGDQPTSVPDGTKPLPGPMLTEIYVAIWRHYASMLIREHYTGFGWSFICTVGSWRRVLEPRPICTYNSVKWTDRLDIRYTPPSIQLIVALWHHMATEVWVNIGSGNGLLPDGTKPLPEPMLTYHQWGPDIHQEEISWEMSQPSIAKMNLKTT